MEDYVTFEQAMKLKELGFNWECNHYYQDNDQSLHPNFYENFNKHNKLYTDNEELKKATLSSAPTLSQAAKWLREKGIDLDITLYRDIDATKDVPTIKRYYNCEIAFGEDDEDLDEDFDTYEQALSAGIDRALELLK